MKVKKVAMTTNRPDILESLASVLVEANEEPTTAAIKPLRVHSNFIACLANPKTLKPYYSLYETNGYVKIYKPTTFDYIDIQGSGFYDGGDSNDDYAVSARGGNEFPRYHTPDGVVERGTGLGTVLYFAGSLGAKLTSVLPDLPGSGNPGISSGIGASYSARKWWKRAVAKGLAQFYQVKYFPSTQYVKDYTEFASPETSYVLPIGVVSSTDHALRTERVLLSDCLGYYDQIGETQPPLEGSSIEVYFDMDYVTHKAVDKVAEALKDNSLKARIKQFVLESLKAKRDGEYPQFIQKIEEIVSGFGNDKKLLKGEKFVARPTAVLGDLMRYLTSEHNICYGKIYNVVVSYKVAKPTDEDGAAVMDCYQIAASEVLSTGTVIFDKHGVRTRDRDLILALDLSDIKDIKIKEHFVLMAKHAGATPEQLMTMAKKAGVAVNDKANEIWLQEMTQFPKMKLPEPFRDEEAGAEADIAEADKPASNPGARFFPELQDLDD